MKRYLIILLIVLLSSNLIFSQNKIEGKVFDQDNSVIPFSLILLKQQDSIIDYSFSDFDGKFIILQDIKPGMYLETHFFEETNITKLDSEIKNIQIVLKWTKKITKEQVCKWQEEMFDKYKLEFKYYEE